MRLYSFIRWPRCGVRWRTSRSSSVSGKAAYPVLHHRLVTTFNADAEGITTDAIIDKILEAIPLPQEEAAAKVKRA